MKRKTSRQEKHDFLLEQLLKVRQAKEDFKPIKSRKRGIFGLIANLLF